MARQPSVNEQIDAEIEEWKKEGMLTENVKINVFLLDAQVRAIIRLLEKHGYSKAELDREYKKVVLENMKKARKELAPLVRQARTRALIEIPNG